MQKITFLNLLVSIEELKINLQKIEIILQWAILIKFVKV